MNSYKVTIEKSTVQTRVAEIVVDAENEADAVVLAKYKHLNSWDFGEALKVEKEPVILVIGQGNVVVESLAVEPPAIDAEFQP